MYKIKEKVLSIRLSMDEYEFLRQAADHEEMKMSAYMRKLLHNKQIQKKRIQDKHKASNEDIQE